MTSLEIIQHFQSEQKQADIQFLQTISLVFALGSIVMFYSAMPLYRIDKNPLVLLICGVFWLISLVALVGSYNI